VYALLANIDCHGAHDELLELWSESMYSGEILSDSISEILIFLERVPLVWHPLHARVLCILILSPPKFLPGTPHCGLQYSRCPSVTQPPKSWMRPCFQWYILVGDKQKVWVNHSHLFLFGAGQYTVVEKSQMSDLVDTMNACNLTYKQEN